MEMKPEDKRELSEHLNSSISGFATSKESQDRVPSETKLSYKVNLILAACEESDDLDLLVRLATSTGGLINDEVRKVACKSLTELKCPYSLTLTAAEGPFCLATEVRNPSSPTLLALGGVFQAIKMKIRSSLT